MKTTIAFILSATAATAGSLSDPIVESVRPIARHECVDRGWIRITGTNACMYAGREFVEEQGREDRPQSRPDRPDPVADPDPQDEPEREPEQEPEREECR